MTFIEAPTTFYLGRRYDPAAGKLTGDVVYYDSRDLTTHAVVLGMTGSGKTGLCITLLEEAILDNLPALIIDPRATSPTCCSTSRICGRRTSSRG